MYKEVTALYTCYSQRTATYSEGDTILMRLSMHHIAAVTGAARASIIHHLKNATVVIFRDGPRPRYWSTPVLATPAQYKSSPVCPRDSVHFIAELLAGKHWRKLVAKKREIGRLSHCEVSTIHCRVASRI